MNEFIGRKGSTTNEQEYLKTGTQVVEKSIDFDVVDGDGVNSILMNTGSTTKTTKLPVLASSIGRELSFCKSGTGNYVVDGDGATINGSSTTTITVNTSGLTIKAFASEWRII